MKFFDGEWTPATLSRHGEYLLPLTATFAAEQLHQIPDFDLAVENDLGPLSTFAEFRASTWRRTRRSHLVSAPALRSCGKDAGTSHSESTAWHSCI